MQRFCPVWLFIFCFFLAPAAKGEMHNVPGKPFLVKQVTSDTVPHSDSVVPHHKHRLWAALLSFPLGIFGTHRMYLGAPAKVPMMYIVTFGGGFGILPFIDCVLILLSKDVNVYANNPHVFMWSK